MKDAKGDSHPVYGEFIRQGASRTSRLDNNGGVGTTATSSYSETILSVRACVNKQLLPDTCGAWG